MKRRFLAGFAATFALLVGVPSIGAVPAAHAEVEPGGWRSINPGFREQERGCGDVNGLTFRLSCGNTNGDQRAERRYDTYTSGVRQFEGFFRITGGGGSRISLKQTFARGPFFILAVDRGGRLYEVGGDTLVDRVAMPGARVRVNTVHDVGGRSLRVYINGRREHTRQSSGNSFYDKFGAYRTNSGRGPITVEWSDVRFWQK